jgi:hypothetical protein
LAVRLLVMLKIVKNKITVVNNDLFK